MNKEKTDRLHKIFSQTLHPKAISLSSAFEDSMLNQNSKAPNLSEFRSVFNLSSKKSNVRGKSYHESSTRKPQLTPIFPSSSKSKDIMKITNLEILNKLKNLCTNYLINPENKQGKIVKCLIKSIKTLNEMDFSYKESFALVPQILDSIFYFESHVQNRYKTVLSECESPTIKSCLKLDQLSRIPYNLMSSILLQELELKESKHKENVKNLTNELQNNIETQKQKDLIENLKKTIELKQNDENSSSLKIFQLSSEISTLKTENKEINVYLKQLKSKKSDLEEDVQIFLNRCEKYQKQLEKSEKSLNQEIIEKQAIIQQYNEKKNNMETLKLQCQSFKHILDKILIKVSTISSEYQKIWIESQKISEENKTLNLKAGIGFDNLTPRPNFQSLFDEKHLKLTNFVQKTKKKLTTNFIIESLLNKFCENQGKLLLFQIENKRKNNQKKDDKTQLNRPLVSSVKQEKRDSIFDNSQSIQRLNSIMKLESPIINSEMMISIYNKESIQELDKNSEELSIKKEILKDVIEAKKLLTEIL